MNAFQGDFLAREWQWGFSARQVSAILGSSSLVISVYFWFVKTYHIVPRVCLFNSALMAVPLAVVALQVTRRSPFDTGYSWFWLFIASSLSTMVHQFYLERQPEVRFMKKQTVQDILQSAGSGKKDRRERQIKYRELSKWIKRDKNIRIQMYFNITYGILLILQVLFPVTNLIPYLCTAPAFFLWYSHSYITKHVFNTIAALAY